MAPVLSLSAFLLSLFLLLGSCYSKVHEDDHGLQVVELSTLKPANVCSEWKAPSQSSLRIVHQHGPCSPSSFGGPNDAHTLARDTLRVAYIQNRIRLANGKGNMSMDHLQTSLEVILPVRNGDYIGSLNYVLTIGIGTPRRDQTVIFDTGSNLCWLQCEPCQSCYPQAERRYNSTASPTYRNVACNAPACTSLPLIGAARGCHNNACTYIVQLEDRSSSMGFLAMERLELSAPQLRPVVIPNFVFGCGQSNAGIFGRTAGLFGLGRHFHSLVSQTSSIYGNVFSYCLPSMNNIPGYLTIGRRPAPSPAYTPMMAGGHGDLGFYFIDLVGISVARQRLLLPPTLFRSVGTTIDSGAVITRLPPAAYRALRDAFRSGMTRYHLAPPFETLDTCYILGGHNLTYPTVTLHFDRVDLPLKLLQTFYIVNTTKHCLAFSASPSGEASIFGNAQQRGMEVIYDIEQRRIGFSTGTNCR